MDTTILNVPVTLSERLLFPEELRIPASFDEFLELLEDCEYRIEYDNDEIISFIGFGTPAHEKLCATIARLLGNMLNQKLYSVYGSNLALHIPGFKRRYYNADCAIIRGAEERALLRGSMEAVVNPVLLVEVLSKSTRHFDLGQKLKNYQKIPSLQQILLVETTEKSITSYTRQPGTEGWLSREFSAAGDEIFVLGEGNLRLEEVYANVVLEA